MFMVEIFFAAAPRGEPLRELGLKPLQQAHHAEDGVVAGRRIAAVGGPAGGLDLDPEDAALLDDDVVLGGRAEHQGVGLDQPILAQIRGAFRPQALLVAGEHEDHASQPGPAAPGDFVREPEVDRRRALAVVGAEPVDAALLQRRGEGVGAPGRAVAGADRVDVGIEHHAGRALAQPRNQIGDRWGSHGHGDVVAGRLEMLAGGFADRPRVAGRGDGRNRDQLGKERVQRIGDGFLIVRHGYSSLSARMMDVPESERGSRAPQRPFSTWAKKSAQAWLKASGSSRLMVWPDFGITSRPAVGIVRLR